MNKKIGLTEVVLRDGGTNFGYFHQDSDNFEIISKNSMNQIIDYSKKRQIENNNIYKNDKLKYFSKNVQIP